MNYNEAKALCERSQFLIGEKVMFRTHHYEITIIDIVPTNLDEREDFLNCYILRGEDYCLNRFKGSDLCVRYGAGGIGLYMSIDELIQSNPDYLWLLDNNSN